jgi:hypothetical protein
MSFLDDGLLDELLDNWPGELARPEKPVNWLPSARLASKQAVDRAVLSYDSVERVPKYVQGASNYTYWLNDRYIIPDQPAEMIWDSLTAGGPAQRALGEIALIVCISDVSLLDVTRTFEQQYLKLAPLDPSDDKNDSDYISNDPASEYYDSDLRLREDRFYVRDGFEDTYWWERHGGEVPTTALERVMGLEPGELRPLIEHYKVDPHSVSDEPILAWTILKADQYLFKARPFEGDDSRVSIAAPILELCRTGTYVLERLLRIYEAGMQHQTT